MPPGALTETLVSKKQPSKSASQPSAEEEVDRVEFQAPVSWVAKLDEAAAAALGLSRSTYIRMACNRQMKRDLANPADSD